MAWTVSSLIRVGAQAMVGPVVVAIGIFVLLATVRFVRRVLSLSSGIESLLTASATRTRRISVRLGLDDPRTFSQAVAGVGLVLTALALWHFWPFILAFSTLDISTQGADRFVRLQPRGQGRLDAQLYRVTLTALAFGFGVALAHLRRLRGTRAVREAGAGLALVAAMFLLTALLCQLPYRIVWKNDSPRVDIGGERCFQIGESADNLLIHCPDRQPPRNRVVRRGDPAVVPTGLTQNIFTPPEISR